MLKKIPSSDITLKHPVVSQLNLGCGDWIMHYCINCDKEQVKGVNIILDLDYPLPFKDKSIFLIRLLKVIQHVKNQQLLMKEMDRVLKVGGKVEISQCDCNIEKHKNSPWGVFEKVEKRLKHEM